MQEVRENSSTSDVQWVRPAVFGRMWPLGFYEARVNRYAGITATRLNPVRPRTSEGEVNMITEKTEEGEFGERTFERMMEPFDPAQEDPVDHETWGGY